MSFVNIPHGQPIPLKTWARATDVLADYIRAGEKFVAAGRPANGDIAREFEKCEGDYQEMADAIWFAKMTNEQREEWARISTNSTFTHSPKEENKP